MTAIARAAHIAGLKSCMERAIDMGEIQQIDFPLDHYFTGTQYARRIYMPAGSTVVSAVHKTEHITIALKGHCVVVDETGDRQDIVAPAVFVTQPGTQRALYIVSDAEWVTIHTYEEKDRTPEGVRKALVCESMDEYIELQLLEKL